MEVRLSAYDIPFKTRGADVALDVSFDPQLKQVKAIATGTLQDGEVVHQKQFCETVPQAYEISVYAYGINGTPGKDGIDGAPGQDGYNGRNATECNDATRGGDGEPGGAGTPGTSGGPGGDGGDIIVNVDIENTDVLALLRVHNEGGSGGAPGRHGVGGPGGRGGRGGRGYSWTTTRQVPKIGGQPGETETVHDTHTRYPARNGRDGKAGHTPTIPLYAGAKGEDGTLRVNVSTDTSVKSYSGVYHLTLRRFRISSSTENGIYEPGDTLEISNIELRNDGHMPTPHGKKVRIAIETSNIMATNTQEILLIEPIPPGGSMQIPGRLVFTLKEYAGKVSAPLREDYPLLFKAEAVRLQRELRDFDRVRSCLRVSHPIEISQISAPKALLSGEFSSVTFEIRNYSLKEIGSAASERALQRAITLACNLEAPPSVGGRVVFCDARGKTIPEPLIVFGLSKIDPKGSVTATCHVKIEGVREDHTVHSVKSTLTIDKIGKPGDPKCVHSPTVLIKEGISYTPKAEDDFLLVTHKNTTKEQIVAWRELANDLGLSFAIWDTSIHEHLRLEESQTGEVSSSLLTTWRDKLIVVLNTWDYSGESEPAPLNLISQADLHKALSHNNIRLCVVGDSIGLAGRPSLMEEIPVIAKCFHDGISQFKRALRHTPPPVNISHVIDVSRTHFYPFSTGGKEHLQAEVYRVREYLWSRFPGQSFRVKSEYNPSPGRSFLFDKIRTEGLGRIEVQREETPAAGIVFEAQVDRQLAESSCFVHSIPNKVALLASLPAQKLATLVAKALSSGKASPAAAEPFIHAALLRIATEAGFTLPYYERPTYMGLPTLEFLKRDLLSQTDDTTHPVLDTYVSLMSRLSHLYKQEIPWTQRLFPFGDNHAIARDFSRNLTEIQRHVGDLLTNKERSQHRQLMKAAELQLGKTYGDKNKGRLADALKSNDTGTTSAIVTHNPYLGRPSSAQSSFNEHYKRIEADVSAKILKRSVMVKKLIPMASPSSNTAP
jgi:hypothetical protein